MKIKITGKYLVLPVNTATREKILYFENEAGETVFDFSVPLDAVNTKFYSYVNVQRFFGSEFNIRIEPEAALSYRFSDIMDEEDPPNSLRPFVHYTPRTGWLSDPNGLCFSEGKYHMFYQYNPGSTMWGNMHWGHAVSEDLLHWTELDPALYPDSSGEMFSGSAYVDTENSSGLRQREGDHDPIILYYTAAGGITEQSKGKKFTQCVAYSVDGGISFEKYARNPILEHYRAENRDPKVIWAPELDRYVMALYIEDNTYALFVSDNLLDWSEFQRLTLPNDINCPDFYPLVGDDGQKLWVFSGGNDYYTVGRLTKEEFEPIQNVRPFHFGENCSCAGQTFAFPGSKESGSLYDRRIRLVYERIHMSYAPFENQMGIPTEMSLKKIGDIYRLCSLPVEEIRSIYELMEKSENIVLRKGESCRISLKPCAYDISFKSKMNTGRFSVTVFGINMTIMPDRNKLILEKQHSEMNDMPLSYRGKDINIRMIVDAAGIEIFSDGGLVYSTSAVQSDFGMAYIRFDAEEDAVIDSMTAYSLKKVR